MNVTDQRMSESRRNFEMEDAERIAEIRRFIGCALLPQDRESIVAEFDKLIERYKLYTQSPE